MHRSLLIGLLAGILAAILFAFASSGPLPTRIALFLITPLPIFVAGLAAQWSAAAIASVTACLLATALFPSPLAGLTFAATQMLPATFLCYFAQLYRDGSPTDVDSRQTPDLGPNTPDTPDTPDTRQWYPLGWIVLWATAIAILLAIALMAVISTDADALKTLLRTRIDALIDAQMPSRKTGKAVSLSDREFMTEVTLYLLPAAFAVSSLATLLLNLWLAGRITRSNDLLNRPWPDLAAITYPTGTPIALALSLVAAWSLSGIPGLAASAAAGGLFFAYLLLGLAIIHHVTRGHEWRSFALVALYLAMIVLNSALVILIVLVGLAEPISPLRRSFINPPTGASHNDN